jgi:phage/plasmid-associated DNA primase
MYGQGKDGKGTLNRFLARVFGGAFCAKTPPAKGDKFWTFGLIGKRLVSFADCDDTKFVASGLFKSLTGGDPMPVEAKKQMAFTYMPVAKYLFFSNRKPEISSERSDQRRIIYCEFKPADVVDEAGFQERLWEEGGAFLTNCIVKYAEAHREPGPIICENEKILRGHI